MTDNLIIIVCRKQFYYLLICLVSSFTIISCAKEYEVWNPSVTNRPSTTPTFNNYLIIDTLATDKFKITSSNARVFFSMFGSDCLYYEFDINNDKVADIALSCSLTRGPIGIFSYGGSSIGTLNKNTEIDIKRTKYPIANYSNTYLDYAQRPVTIHYRENYENGFNYPANLKVDTITAIDPKIHSVGDTLGYSGLWSSGCFGLVYDKIQQDYWMESIHTGIWRQVYKKFIGVRYTDGRRMFYGWIEINSIQWDNAYEIKLYKYALKMK